MSSPIVQMRHKAENLNAAVEAIREAKPDTERLDTALAEPMLADEDRIVAIVAELAEMVTRQERAINYAGDHVIADLTKRVEKLEKGAEKPSPKSRKK